MKIVHLTDLHVQTRPSLAELNLKRLMGSTNLFLLGRKRKFSLAAQQAAVQATLDLQPDMVVFTGDLTAQALDDEFTAARDLLDPLLDRFPTVLIPGNHDTYVAEPAPGDRMRALFGQWMGPRSPWLHQHGDVGFLHIETCRTTLLSSGTVPGGQLAQAQSLLADCSASFVFLLVHYPLRGRRGEPYGPATRALDNAAQVEAFLGQTDRVQAVLHGHEHHGFRTTIDTLAGPVPILNPGASGYAHLPDKDRTAHLNVYEVGNGRIESVDRYRFDGQRFDAEPGGAYATGR